MKMTFNTALLALGTLCMTSCVSQRAAPEDRKQSLASYMHKLNMPTHRKFIENEVAKPAFESNAATIRLDKDDSTKHNYMEKYGATATTRDSKPVYLLDRGWTVGIMMRNVPIRNAENQLQYIAPIVYLDQVDDGKEESYFDMRLKQLENDRTKHFVPSLGEKLRQKDRFRVNKDGTVTERIDVSNTFNMYLDATYDFKNETIYTEMSGFPETRQKVCTYKEANSVTKEIYGFARDFALQAK